MGLFSTLQALKIVELLKVKETVPPLKVAAFAKNKLCLKPRNVIDIREAHLSAI